MTKEAGTDQVGERLVLPSAPASLHSEEAESDSPTGTRHTTANECLPSRHYPLRLPLRLRHLSDPSIYPVRLPAWLSKQACHRPLLPIWIYPRYRYPLFYRYFDSLVATRNSPSILSFRPTETGTPGFSLCPPVSVRQLRLAPCAELPPMQGRSRLPLDD